MRVASLKHDRVELPAENQNLLHRPTRIAGESLQPRSDLGDDSDNDNDALREVQHQSAAWPHRHE